MSENFSADSTPENKKPTTENEGDDGKATKKSAMVTKCQFCPYETCYKSNMREHVLRIHDRARDHICGDCGASFTTASSLTIHVRAVHMKIKGGSAKKAEKGFQN